MSNLFSLRKSGIACFCAIALLLTGCASAKIAPAPRNIMPIAAIADELPPYRMQIGDVLEIKMLLNPELNEEVIIRPDGKISTAVAQNVLAFGLTPEELQDLLNERYTTHLSDPSVAVIVKTFAPARIYVMGEVNNPGEYLSEGLSMTLLQALALAGGVKNSADTNEIILLRRGSGEEPKAYFADYDAAISGAEPEADVRLAAYDVVFVPRTGIAEFHKYYEQYVQQFIRPSIGIGAYYAVGNNQ
ncbi:MAG: polysaccharide export protein [Rhodospirillales bacterium]|nr:polysaccharide export protein [Rhodospirillales bacterium]